MNISPEQIQKLLKLLYEKLSPYKKKKLARAFGQTAAQIPATTLAPTTQAPTTLAPTTLAPTTQPAATQAPSTQPAVTQAQPAVTQPAVTQAVPGQAVVGAPPDYNAIAAAAQTLAGQAANAAALGQGSYGRRRRHRYGH